MSGILVVSPECSKESAKYLAELLNADYKKVGNEIDYTKYSAIINYGSSKVSLPDVKVINTPKAVRLCINKISTFKRVKHTVQWTKDKEVALSWLQKDGAVVAREKECGNKSSGVVVCEDMSTFSTAKAKFWTRYFWHDHEVRINVFKGKVLSVYEKVIEDGFFVFKQLKIEGEHPQVMEMIDSITNNIGIDLYGMDVLVNSTGKCRLLEVNSGAVLSEGTEDTLVSEIRKELPNYA